LGSCSPRPSRAAAESRGHAGPRSSAASSNALGNSVRVGVDPLGLLGDLAGVGRAGRRDQAEYGTGQDADLDVLGA
ncbi:MAG: hypothetical protein NVV66_00340, partial [Cellulomonas sp.]|uniref:hypothetical protein n=1 Tax=Cellulomonas sp. TaxID=40001 RepID=UPI0025860F64